MARGTKIEWARHPVTGKGASWNPLLARTKASGKVGYHCEHASPGCVNCYAEAFNLRRLPNRGTGLAFKPGHREHVDIFLDEAQLLLPLKWRAPLGVFVCSMTDLFGDFVPDQLIDRMLAVMVLAPQHVFMVLTKRAERMRRYLSDPAARRRVYELACDIALEHNLRVVLVAPGVNPVHAPRGPQVHLDKWPIPNLWPGVSVEDQRRAEERVPHLLNTPAAARFLSAEPLLEHVDLTGVSAGGGVVVNALRGHRSDVFDGTFGSKVEPSGRVHWVIAGFESGTQARPAAAAPEIARSLRDQCASAGVPFFFKQWGSWAFAPDGMDHRAAMAWGQRHRYSLSRPSEAWGGSGGIPSRYEYFENGRTAFYTGKKDAGRLLDGVEHDAMPELR